MRMKFLKKFFNRSLIVSLVYRRFRRWIIREALCDVFSTKFQELFIIELVGKVVIIKLIIKGIVIYF